MNKWTTGFFGTLILASLGVAGVFAQSPPAVRVNIPFAFAIGDNTLPPGVYVFRETGATGGLLAIRSVNGSDGEIFSTLPAPATRGVGSAPQLRFHKYGDKYFLSAVWPGYGDTGWQLHQSKRERELMTMTDMPGTEVVATVRR